MQLTLRIDVLFEHFKQAQINWAKYVSQKLHSLTTGVVTVQDSQSGKSFSSILNLAKNVQKSQIKCLKEQNIHRKLQFMLIL